MVLMHILSLRREGLGSVPGTRGNKFCTSSTPIYLQFGKQDMKSHTTNMAKNSGNSKIHIRGTASRGSLYDSQN
jgi:hypothetical protein